MDHVKVRVKGKRMWCKNFWSKRWNRFTYSRQGLFRVEITKPGNNFTILNIHMAKNKTKITITRCKYTMNCTVSTGRTFHYVFLVYMAIAYFSSVHSLHSIMLPSAMINGIKANGININLMQCTMGATIENKNLISGLYRIKNNIRK